MATGPDAPDVRDTVILVVDDIAANREGLTAFLRAEGFTRVEMAADATAAMDRLVAGHVDLVLLDVMLPDMPGDRVLAWMDTDPRLRQVPVIMVSGVDAMQVVVRCLEAGAVDFLPEPVDPVLLRARLYPALERKRLRDALMRSHARIEQELAQARALQLGMVPRSFPAPGVAEPVELPIRREAFNGEEVDRFLRKQGAAWGVRPEIIAKASFGVNQLVEAVFENCWKTGPLRIDATFDEYHLDIRLAYTGDLLAFPSARPGESDILEADDGVRLLAGYLLRQNADRVGSQRRGERCIVRFRFDH
jgi:CheY-like chemotaxis protein